MMMNQAANQRPLFVYGTLKTGKENYPLYLAGKTIHEQPATITGAVLYTEGMYPFLVLDPSLARPADMVEGMLMTLAPAHYAATMRHVDDLEDYEPGNPDNWYERVAHPVQADGHIVEAWVYVAGARTIAAIRDGQLMRLPGRSWSRDVRHWPNKFR